MYLVDQEYYYNRFPTSHRLMYLDLNNFRRYQTNGNLLLQAFMPLLFLTWHK